MKGPKYTLQDVINRFLPKLSAHKGIPLHHLRVLSSLQKCRTASLGGQMVACSDCGHVHFTYHSCRNRHCPGCQGIDRERWIMAREADLLPMRYFHLVFTLPDAMHPLCRYHAEDMYNMLFRVVWDVLNSFAGDPKWMGAQLGATAILHTWTQQMQLHPHIHLIVPSGGLINKQEWKQARNRGEFLFCVEQLSDVFRGRFVAALRLWGIGKMVTIPRKLTDQLFQHDWVVFAKQPFMGPQQVIEYLGRYTHRIAIANYRIKEITETDVIFSYKDRRDKDDKGRAREKQQKLRGEKFLERFCQHILPAGFTRIRHYGFLASRGKTRALAIIRQQLKVKAPVKEQLSWQEIAKRKWDFDPEKCKHCGGKLQIVQSLAKQRAPPLPLFSVKSVVESFLSNC